MTYHHADVVLFTSFALLHSFINDKIHERIKTTQNSSHKPTSIQPHWNINTKVNNHTISYSTMQQPHSHHAIYTA